MKLASQALCFLMVSVLLLFTSCRKKVEVEFNCGVVRTEVTELDHRVGAYSSLDFINTRSSNYEEAAIAIFIEGFTITSETETSCFSFTAQPQLIDEIRITSTGSVTSGGVEFTPGENLMELFKLHEMEQEYDVIGFINAQNNEPLIFHQEGDEIVLQLLIQPDVEINQSFRVEITFDDLKVVRVDVPTFEVAN